LKILVDESLSERVAHDLREAGHDAIHLGALGLLGSPDRIVMRIAQQQGRVLIAADTDFGELLALSHNPGPSLILMRRAPHRPVAQARIILQNLAQIEGDLAAGAVVVMTAQRLRIRLLPIEPREI
jgi:predicted nuclease of predicted toxin-antitoxin system